MELKSKEKPIDLEKEVFNIKNKSMPNGSWLWWFWLFFFNNPKNSEKPRQLMILWSTRNSKEMECNNLKIKINQNPNRSILNGVVAAWYFDGEKMNHSFLLEPCNFKIKDKELSSDSTVPTYFSVDKNKNIVKIGNKFEFITKAENKHSFTSPIYQTNTYISNKGYTMLKLNHLNLNGKVENKPIHGSAYFQRVLVNSPLSSWYWGLVHFENGGVMTYFNPYFLGKSFRKDISFFDGKEMHKFDDIILKKNGEKTPSFIVSGENKNEKINFIVNSYSHSSWTLKKKSLGIIPSKLIYNEYPSVVSEFKLINKKTGEKITLENLGKAVGNVEHGIGLLF
jgi:hypothetical protein